MLFDLRSRGRRRTMQVIYLGLAVLMAAGLVLFGVGTGTGGGGLLGGLSGSSSNNNQSSAVGKAVSQAQANVAKHPSDPAAYAKLIEARWENAQSAGFKGTGFTAFGKLQLKQLTVAYERYSKLVTKPDVTTATYAARAYSYLGDYANQAATWSAITTAHPSLVGYKCLTLSAYAAKNTRLASLAQGKVLAQVPKKQRATVARQLQAAESQPTQAQGC